jgi:hypothetical protein
MTDQTDRTARAAPPGAVAGPQPSSRGCLYAAAIVVIAIVVVAGVALLVAANGKKSSGTAVVKSSSGAPIPATAAERVSRGITVSCGHQAQNAKTVQAVVTAANQSSETSNYLVVVQFKGADGKQIVTKAALVSDVMPGSSRTSLITTVVPSSTSGLAVTTCSVASATRIPYPGPNRGSQ